MANISVQTDAEHEHSDGTLHRMHGRKPKLERWQGKALETHGELVCGECRTKVHLNLTIVQEDGKRPDAAA